MRKSMEKSCDRISELPDGILDSILSLLPLNYAIRTSILSKRWTNLWKTSFSYATDLDFGKDFANAQTREQFVSTVNRYLQLHNSNEIDELKLYFHPGEDYKSDLTKWIEFAIRKEVKNLNLIFCQGIEYYTSAEHEDKKEEYKLPDVFFGCNTLISLRASHFEFIPTAEFRGFRSLVTLQLNEVNITDDVLEKILSTCPVLSNLYLRFCFSLRSIKISGPDLQLKTLSLIVTNAYEVEIFAPKLRSVHFYGDILYGYTFRNVAALEDVFISADGYEFTEPEHDFIQILSGVSHIKILTMCIGAPMILIGGQLGEEYLGLIFGFFKHTVCPCLMRLFIDLSGPYVPIIQPYTKEAEVPFNCTFYNLRIVKINHFRGSDSEIKLVKFFLDTAFLLETLILVAAPDSFTDTVRNNIEDGFGAFHSGAFKKTTSLLRDEMLCWPKASKDAQILLFEHSGFDTTIQPFHKHVDYYLDNKCCDF
ncbi:hypothetical protein AQUCO_12100007v1 [Aquilegia coerulea]|uniref:F-box domain-containing protein n=1 Tax=Aquilegia coerulea TaxID=218851 RepID=A0A2G5C1U1_AQUCA|nr:hypothetical protein AQUCO_12100007v1 [Aquilegia coerulea]